MKKQEQIYLPKETVCYGEWKDDMIDSIKQNILKLFTNKKKLNMNEEGLVKKINAYISFGSDDFKIIADLHKYFPNYYFVSRLDKKLPLTDINVDIEWKRLIEDSDIFIVYATGNYLRSEIGRQEYNFAVSLNKKILCLLTKSIIDYEMNGSQSLEKEKSQLKEMRKYSIYDLKQYCMFGTDWREISKILEDRINEIIKENKKNLNITPNILLKDFDKPFNIKIVDNHNYLLRGTIFTDNEFLIINFNRSDSKHSLAYYDANKLFENENLLFSSSYDLAGKEPSLVLVKNEKEILLVDSSTGSLVIFQKDFIQYDSYNLELNNYCDMAIDEDMNEIYFVKCIDHSDIKVFDYNNKKEKPIEFYKSELKKSEKFKPRFIKVNGSEVFIINACSIEIDADSREIKNVIFGESFIYVLDKNSYLVKICVNLKNYAMCQPWNLIVDKDSNIYTTVSQINEKKFISKERFLCKLNKDGDMLDCCQLEHTYLSNDMILVDNKLIFFKENLMNIYAK